MNPAGYSGTPLAKKLGIKENYNCYFEQIPEYYFNLFDSMPDIEVMEVPKQEGLDFAHAFYMSQDEMKASFPKIKDYLKKTGMVWISWPKKAAKLDSDLDSNIVRKYGLNIGLVDTKVAAIDETWSGLKFMYRIKDR